jgi:hypothetical protein
MTDTSYFWLIAATGQGPLAGYTLTSSQSNMGPAAALYVIARILKACTSPDKVMTLDPVISCQARSAEDEGDLLPQTTLSMKNPKMLTVLGRS